MNNIQGMEEQKKYCDTNTTVIKMMVKALDYKRGDILEPSAGTGAIIKALQPMMYKPFDIYYCELNQRRASQTDDDTQSIFLDFDFLKLSRKWMFKYIIAVPPFHNLECIAHTQKMLLHLLPSGKMVVVLPTVSLENKEFKEWIEMEKGTITTIEECTCEYECKTFMLQITKPY